MGEPRRVTAARPARRSRAPTHYQGYNWVRRDAALYEVTRLRPPRTASLCPMADRNEACEGSPNPETSGGRMGVRPPGLSLS